MWTFTFSTLYADWECSQRFSDFLRSLRQRNWCPADVGGVKVAELHKEHGVHFHCLVNRRLPVDYVRKLWRKYGGGRLHVCVADIGAAKYLSKYLSKAKEKPFTESGGHCRAWASFGEVKKTRVSDLVNESPEWVFRRNEKLPWLGFHLEFHLRECWMRGGELQLRTGWFAARAGRLQDLVGLACGQAEARGGGVIVWRSAAVEGCHPF